MKETDLKYTSAELTGMIHQLDLRTKKMEGANMMPRLLVWLTEWVEKVRFGEGGY